MDQDSSQNTSRTILYRNVKCCEDCQDSSVGGPNKLYPSENNTSTVSYNQKGKKTERSTTLEETRKNYPKYGTVTLSGVTKTHSKKFESGLGCNPGHLDECIYRRRCYQCRDLVVRIRSLLDEIKAIKKYENTAGILCDFCNRLTVSGKCKRCEFLVNRYKISETIDDEARQQRFKIWLCKVKQFLYSILERQTCKHKVYPRTEATDELTNLLHELKSPLNVREPDIGYFPSIDSLENITESKDILEQVLTRLKSDRKSQEYFPDASCICKYFADKKYKEKPMDEEIDIVSENLDLMPTLETKEMRETVKAKTNKDYEKSTKDITKKKENSKDEKKILKEDKKSLKDDKKSLKGDKRTSKGEKRPSKFDKKSKDDRKGSKQDSIKKAKGHSEDDLMAKLMKSAAAGPREKERKPVKAPPPPTMPKIEELPVLVRKVKEIVESTSESFIECELEDGELNEMIKGEQVVPLGPRKEEDTGSVKPLLFKKQADCPSLPEHNPTPSTTPTRTTDKKKGKDGDADIHKGVIRYSLSNREFIEKGWTLLPTTKIMRRMNIYKMVPVNPKYDWFERRKKEKFVYYDTGEKFAEIQEDGSGKWYYKNGALALDYYCAQDTNCGHRYVVYSSGENTDVGRHLPVTILATFDYLGNGIVYDHYGNERIKYNQSEGMVIDDKIGAPGRWKWHTLNEPPVLQPVFMDTQLRPTGCLEELLRGKKDDASGSKHKREPNLDMLAIELENFLKEKAHKLLQEFKPFQIKMKALKMNEQFSLKVLDQSSIFLQFRDGHTSAKVNLGMRLISNEIVDTDCAEVTQVATPYDRHPPKSESIADIQTALEKARKLGKSRGKLRN